MSNAKARAWLRKWARQTHGSEMLDMKGSWVAQVSSKCTGLDVDIDGGMPDGTVDTYGVDDAQILGFHLALKESMSAVTMKWSELSDNPTTGPCAGKTLTAPLAMCGIP